MSERDELGHRADELRRCFDAAFAEPARTRVAAVERLLLLRLGPDGYAFRLHEIGGLQAARKVAPITSSIPEVSGLAGLRGNLVPVYRLSALLGYGQSSEAPRWFVSCRDAEPIALGFGTLDGYAEEPASELHAPAAGEAPRLHVQSLVRTNERTVAVLDVAQLVAAIKQRAPKER